MIVREVAQLLESLAPLATAEDFDNVGLLVGDPQAEVSGILITLDTLESVVDEAISKNCNLIVSFHPILFKGLKRIGTQTYVERVVTKAIQNKISIYAVHTALDNASEGVNAAICERLGLQDTSILIPKPASLKKLSTYVPASALDALLEGLFEAGAGDIGKYSHCSFLLEGRGSFKPDSDAQPAFGTPGKFHTEKETQVQVVFPSHNEGAVIAALFQHHPYEEIAYEVFAMENTNRHVGMGKIGTLAKPMQEKAFLDLVKKQFKTGCIRHSALLGKTIHKVAVLGGSGAFAIGAARAQKADVFITADLKYHNFFEAEGEFLLMDIGHFESEQFTKPLLYDFLRKKIPNFAILLSESNTNPIYYY